MVAFLIVESYGVSMTKHCSLHWTYEAIKNMSTDHMIIHQPQCVNTPVASCSHATVTFYHMNNVQRVAKTVDFVHLYATNILLRGKLDFYHCEKVCAQAKKLYYEATFCSESLPTS